MRALPWIGLLVTLTGVLSGQQASNFAIASVKLSATTVGPDYANQLAIGPARITGSHVTLKRLIGEAYGVRPFQISGPGWLGSVEYELDARTEAPATPEELRRKLQGLLQERFGLILHREKTERRVYELVVAKNGPKIKPARDGDARGDFHGDLQQFADLLSVQLSIPTVNDPTKPAVASGPPVPVLNQTGLTDIYDIKLDIRPEPGADMFLLWQRVLQEKLGLQLENRKAGVETLLVDRAEKTPSAN